MCCDTEYINSRFSNDRHFYLFLKVERGDMMGAYYRRLTGDNELERLACAKAWSGWEMATSRLFQDPVMMQKTDEDIWSLQIARIEWYQYIYVPIFTYYNMIVLGKC